MEDIVRIHVKLMIKGLEVPLKGKEYSVKFYDKDLLKDDFLGESSVDDVGHAIVSVTKSDYRSKDSPFENYPDVYFTVEKEGVLIYESPVFNNLHLKEAGDFPATGGLHCDLGTFFI